MRLFNVNLTCLATLAVSLTLVACGDDAESAGSGGSGGASAGAGGTGASGGTAGNGASGGSAGSSGASGGTGGASGSAGNTTGGTAGTTGGSGGATGGTGGAAGTPGVEFASEVPLSDTENDRFWAAGFDAQGRVYAAGFVEAAGDTSMSVARFDTLGNLDTSFGIGGVALVNAVVGGTLEAARGVAIQSDGKVVIAGTVEGDPNASYVDANVAVARLNSDGSIDSSFGTAGVQIIDITTGEADINDSLWNIAVDAQDRVLLFGMAKAEARADRDRFVARLTPAGALDTTFNTTGKHVYGVDGLDLSDNGRNGLVQADGKIFHAGYTNVAGSNQIVLARFNTDGSLDTSFDTDGVVRAAPFAAPGMAEAYGAAIQSDGKYVTTGYGRTEGSGPVDLVSFRFAADGSADATWATSGGLLLDVAGDNDRGRNVMALPGDRTIHVGSGSPSAGTVHGMIAITGANGAPDTSFDTDGYKLYDFGSVDQALFGLAVSPDGKWAAAAGYRRVDSADDDSVLVLLPLQ